MPRCPNGSRRNKKTGLCEKYQKKTIKKTCPPDKLLNPKTNRCIKNNTLNKKKLNMGVDKVMSSVIQPKVKIKSPNTIKNLSSIYFKKCSSYSIISYVDIENVKLVTNPSIKCKKYVGTNNPSDTDKYKFVYNNEDLCKIKYLSKGGYGMVHQYSGDNYSIAVKSYFDKKDDELKIGRMLKKANIPCKIINFKMIKRGDNTVSIMNLMNGPLSKLSGKFGINNKYNLLLVIKDITNNLICLKNNKLAYTDLKSDNILFRCVNKNTLETCIGDIGGINKTGKVNACTWLPWEYRYSGGFPIGKEETMVWSLGVVILELLKINTNNFHWSEIKYNTFTDIKNIIKRVTSNNKLKKLNHCQIKPELLLSKMLELDPNKRIKLEQINNYIV
jgi:hypothetical protein